MSSLSKPQARHKPLILALTGRPDVGKDTVGAILCPRYGFARIAFADALRREVAKAWGVDMRMLTERATKETPLPALAAGMCAEPAFIRALADEGQSLTAPRSPRWALQHWASWQRRNAPDYYARIVERWMARQLGIGWRRIVVTDLREPVELAMLTRLGAVVVRVHRPDARPLATDTAGHTSEQHGAIRAQADIVNDGSLQALAEAVQLLLVQLPGQVGQVGQCRA